MTLEACLPTDLRGPATTITPLSHSYSGAGVYRVEAAGEAFVLKVSDAGEPIAGWRRRLRVQQLAADAGLAPRVVHVDEERRAVVSAFVAGLPFPTLYGDPRTRDAALARLGRMVRRVHDLPLPPGAEAMDPRAFLAATWSGIPADFALPPFVGEAVRRVLEEEAPDPGRAPVLSHNDVHPANLLHDGENLLLVDWDTVGPNDPFYDLAAISVFLRMDEEACRKLLAAHDGEPAAAIPARFAYDRRLVAALCGVMFLGMVGRDGHPGAAGGETLDSTLTLAEFYQRMRSGALNHATAEG
ncbi:MAG: phosphotransferase, partial [Gemmatimonadetes bacterium]|nr:phosphotransferase [Gemmatimonadota bacterium]